MTRSGRTYAKGMAAGRAIVLAEPLSLWGGVDVTTGTIIDHSHPDLGKSIAGRILVMPGAKGSSSSSAILAEAIRRGTAPLGIVLGTPDPILVVGAIVAGSLYGLECPIVVCAIDGIASGNEISIVAERGAAQIEVRMG